MLQDPNIERHIQERIKPLQEQIKELQAAMFRLIQANDLHFQDIGDSFSKTKVQDWIEQNKCSARLSNVLKSAFVTTDGEWKKLEYIEDMNVKDWFKNRNAGTRGWREFNELLRS